MIRKCEYYKKLGTAVHVSLNSGQFYNGLIVDVKPNYLIVGDRKLGEVFISYNDLKGEGVVPFKSE